MITLKKKGLIFKAFTQGQCENAKKLSYYLSHDSFRQFILRLLMAVDFVVFVIVIVVVVVKKLVLALLVVTG